MELRGNRTAFLLLRLIIHKECVIKVNIGNIPIDGLLKRRCLRSVMRLSNMIYVKKKLNGIVVYPSTVRDREC